MRRAEQVYHSLDFIKENLRTASKESIAIIKPRENKRGNESFSSFHRKILSDWTNPSNLQMSQLTEFVHLFLQCALTVKNYTEITSCTGKQKKEDQFQEQNQWEESLFCRHLTEVYFELPRPEVLRDKVGTFCPLSQHWHGCYHKRANFNRAACIHHKTHKTR